MELHYMVTATVIFVSIYLVYSILTDLLKFRNKTAGRYVRLIIVGTIAVMTSGGLSAVMWILTFVYGVYVFVASTLGFVFNMFGGSNRSGGSKKSIFKTVFHFLLGFFATEAVLNRFGISNSRNNGVTK